MPHLPDLRVVPLEQIRRHEEIDPLRVNRLSSRISKEGIQVNPMVCIEAPGDQFVLLDGATRTESLKTIGLPHAVVQVVVPETVSLGTWHHVIRGCTPAEVEASVAGGSGLAFDTGDDPPTVHVRNGDSRHVIGEGMTGNAVLSALVTGYMGRWDVTRTTDPEGDRVTGAFPDWAAIVEFPTLTIDDVMEAALSGDLLPAGITRFKVPDRALRLNIPLDTLTGARSTERKQQDLDTLVARRAREGRVRRYEEPVFVLDD